jgi:hypothetical protein
MKRTESYQRYWERQKEESLRRIAVAESNLMRISLQSQLTLFEVPEAQIIELRPLRNDLTA